MFRKVYPLKPMSYENYGFRNLLFGTAKRSLPSKLTIPLAFQLRKKITFSENPMN
jgi:hypothetical protein